MNKEQQIILQKLTRIFSEHKLKDIRIALDALRDERLLSGIEEAAKSTTSQANSRGKTQSQAKRKPPLQRFREIGREIEESGTSEEYEAFKLSATLLDKTAFSGPGVIKGLLEDLGIDTPKSVSDRSRLALALYSYLREDPRTRIPSVANRVGTQSTKSTSLNDWSKLINRRDDGNNDQ